MSKGGGGGGTRSQPTTSRVVQTNLPQYAEPYYQRLLGATEAETARGYQPYTGERYATFSPEQQRGFALAETAVDPNIAFPQIQRAQTALEEVAGYTPDQVRMDHLVRDPTFDFTARDVAYTPGQISSQSFIEGDTAQRYMNPFIENVIDRQKQRARRDFERNVLPSLRAKQVQAGAFGGSRGAIAEQIARSEMERDLLDADAQQRVRAYTEAARIQDLDRASLLRAQALREQAAREAAGVGLASDKVALEAAQRRAALGLGLEELRERAAKDVATTALQSGRLGLEGQALRARAAPQLAEMGGEEQRNILRQAEILRQIGGQRQAERQDLLDIGLAEFMSQRDFPRQQLSFLSGILHGTPITPVSETTQFQRRPSTGQSLLRTGLAGLGALRSIQN